MKVSGLLGVLVLLAACVTIDDEQREHLDYLREDRRNKFIDYQKRCARADGIVVVHSTGGRLRKGIPGIADRYTCIH